MHKSAHTAVAVWAILNKIKYHRLSSRGTFESLNDEHLFETWEETWLNPDAFYLPLQFFSRYKCCVFGVPPVTSFYFGAADELKFTSILQQLNCIAFIGNCRWSLPLRVNLICTAPSGRNVSVHRSIPWTMYAAPARFPRIWEIMADSQES